MSGMEELVDEVRFAWDPVSEFVAQLNVSIAPFPRQVVLFLILFLFT